MNSRARWLQQIKQAGAERSREWDRFQQRKLHAMSRLKINALNGSSDGGDGGDGGDRVADKGESQRKCAASRPWVGIRRRLDAWKMHWAEVNYLYLLFVLFSLIKFFVRFFFVLPVLSISLFFVFFFGGFELRMQKCNMPQCNGDTKVQHQPLTAAVEWVCLRSCRDVQQQRWLCSLFFIFCIFFLHAFALRQQTVVQH